MNDLFKALIEAISRAIHDWSSTARLCVVVLVAAGAATIFERLR